MLPELSVDAGGHDTVDMEGAHRVADVSGMQHCLHQQHSVFLLLHQERACSAHSNNNNIDNDNDNVVIMMITTIIIIMIVTLSSS